MSDMFAAVEHHHGSLRDMSFELVTAGSDLIGDTGGDFHLAIIGGDVDAFAGGLPLAGADAIRTVTEGDEFNHDTAVQAVEALVEELDPTYVLIGGTINSLNYAPAVVERLDHPLVTGAIDLESDGGLVVTREMYTPKVESTVEIDTDRAAVTVCPGKWNATEELGGLAVEAFSFDLDESRVRSRMTGSEEVGSGGADIADADVLVFVDRGVEEEENIEPAQELTDVLGATLPSPWPIINNGWPPKDRQVSQSGEVATPKFYVAVDIPGTVQHATGMRGAENIVVINTNPDAPIFDIADYGTVGDLLDVMPEPAEQFE